MPKTDRTCKWPDCFKPIRSRGLCSPHYQKLHSTNAATRTLAEKYADPPTPPGERNRGWSRRTVKPAAAKAAGAAATAKRNAAVREARAKIAAADAGLAKGVKSESEARADEAAAQAELHADEREPVMVGVDTLGRLLSELAAFAGLTVRPEHANLIFTRDDDQQALLGARDGTLHLLRRHLAPIGDAPAARKA